MTREQHILRRQSCDGPAPGHGRPLPGGGGARPLLHGGHPAAPLRGARGRGSRQEEDGGRHHPPSLQRGHAAERHRGGEAQAASQHRARLVTFPYLSLPFLTFLYLSLPFLGIFKLLTN